MGFVQPSLGATIEVVVGGPGVLKFNPQFVNAKVGDVVRFIMQQKNHTVTQSSLNSPCSLIPGGFDTGFVPVPDSQKTDYPVAELPVDTASPIWAYCRQGAHCQAGMVFAVNPGDKFAAFQQAAMGGSTSASASASGTIQPISTSTSAPAPTATAGINHKVIVGGPGVLAYSPSNITAQVGDTITFEFHQKNHTVTASSFDAPCRALALTSTTGQVGFDSGFIPVADGTSNFPTYTIRVNDTLPIWTYCRQGSHCGSGMVFSVNAVESGPKNFAAFQALAKQLNGTSTTAPPSSGAQSIVRAANPTSFMVVMAILSFLFL